ncbi:hypothetical protein [Coprobacter sp.]|uniref:hypothetical protein n=1 Tax=Coprobacter sp. TaxID=1941478 RepID=UPI003AB36B51
MPNSMKLEKKRSTVTSTSTPNSAKTVSYRDFKTEMDCKNKAYNFILSNGLLEDFTKFCETYHSSDPHKDCMEHLLSKI